MTSIVSLSDVKSFLQIPPTDSMYDAQLTNIFMPAADRVIARECGDVIPAQYDENHDGGSCQIYLWHKPVLAINRVEENWGFTNFVLDFQAADSNPANSMYAYSLDDNESGVITRRTAGNAPVPFVRGLNNIRVTYTAGLAPDDIPSNITLAALQLIAHWWQGAMLRGSGPPGFGNQEVEEFTRSLGTIGGWMGVPNKIVELLKPNRREPIIG